MSSFPIKIYIRTRPTTDFASKNISILDDHQSIEMSIDKLFFELIRVAIGNAACLSHTPTAEEWSELYAMAKVN